MSGYDERIGKLVRKCGEIETKLRVRGAQGSGFKELLESSDIDDDTEKKIRRIAYIRNRAVHGNNRPSATEIENAITSAETVSLHLTKKSPKKESGAVYLYVFLGVVFLLLIMLSRC